MKNRIKAIPSCYAWNWRRATVINALYEAAISPLVLFWALLRCVGLLLFPIWLLLFGPLWAVISVSDEDIDWFMNMNKHRKDKEASDESR